MGARVAAVETAIDGADEGDATCTTVGAADSDFAAGVDGAAVPPVHATRATEKAATTAAVRTL